MLKETTLRIVLQNPVDGLMYGLQKGKGADYTTEQKQLGGGQDLIFKFAIQLKQSNGQGISFSGPFIQGPVGSKFVYINIGSYAGQNETPWNGRLKVPLCEADFQNALNNGHVHGLSCTVPGRNVEGKPVFATVKEFGGWLISMLTN